MVKKAAALTNHQLGMLDQARTKAICAACDELLEGKLHEHFTVDMFQGGAGTSTNMNANEVIANLALELMGEKKGSYHIIHPNDHVNKCQSTNDAYPTAFRIALYQHVSILTEALETLRASFSEKSVEFNVSSNPSTLYETIPLLVAFIYSAPEFSCCSNLAL